MTRARLAVVRTRKRAASIVAASARAERSARTICVHPREFDQPADLVGAVAVIALDVLECPHCRGPMRILATIHPPETTTAILACMGLPVRAPPLAPARRDDGFDDEAADQSPADFES